MCNKEQGFYQADADAINLKNCAESRDELIEICKSRDSKIESLQQENERLEIENVALREIIEQSGVDADELLEASGDE